MIRAGMSACDEGIQPLDPVGEAVLHQEIQRPVGHGRLRALAENIQHFIGAKGPVFAQQDLKPPPTCVGQLQSGGATVLVRSFDGRSDAVRVVVGFESDQS